MRTNKAFTLVEIMIAVVIIGLLATMLVHGIGGVAGGAGPFGPENAVTATVISKHVDSTHDNSHYMVTTTAGTFEVQNGLLLGVWNADELYGNLQPGHKYNIRTKGVKVVNMFLQAYPYVIGINEVQ